MAVDEVVILAGGFGTRLRSEVPDLPKPLAPVAGRPFLAYLLDRYAASGMRRVILATGYMGDVVERTIGARWEGMEVVYSREDSPLGTGGAIAAAARHIQGDGLHVCNGDTYLAYDPIALERACGGFQMAIALATVADVGRYGAVAVDGGHVSRFLEKNAEGGEGLINAGSYYLSADGLRSLPALPCYSFETEVLQPWVKQGRVAAFATTSGFIDIGIPEDFQRAQQLFAGLP